MAIDPELIDKLLKDYQKPEQIIGEGGLLKQLTKALLERALEAELTTHLGIRLPFVGEISTWTHVKSLVTQSGARLCRRTGHSPPTESFI
jgi:hypothetical protein